MAYELRVPKNEKMKQKAKDYLEGLRPEEFNSVEELVAYIAYLHMGTGEYLEIVADLMAEEAEEEAAEEHHKH